MTVVIMVIIIRVAMAVMMAVVIAVVVAVAVVIAVVIAVVVAVAVVMAPGKGFGKNPEKSSLRRKGRFPSGFLIRDRARIGVIGIPINILPAQKRQRNIK